MEYCETEKLRELIPFELSPNQLEISTGIHARQWYKVKNLETQYTTEIFADKVLTALGTPHLYHHLEFKEMNPPENPKSWKRPAQHGNWMYHKGCRCDACRSAVREAKRAYRAKLKE
jgi:hypothetical protein